MTKANALLVLALLPLWACSSGPGEAPAGTIVGFGRTPAVDGVIDKGERV